MRSSKYSDGLKVNQELISLEKFLEIYNSTVPEGFPQASEEALQRFQAAYPSLFKHENAWSIDKHRKKFMDWIAYGKNT